MSDDKEFQNLSPEEKLVVFYTKSSVRLQKLNDDSGNMLSLVDELDLPYHVFNWCRILVEETSELLNLIGELMEGKLHALFPPQDFEDSPAEWKLLTFRSEFTTKFEMWKQYGQWMHNWLEERAALNLPDELIKWCKLVVKSVGEIQDLLATLLNISPSHLVQENSVIHRVDVEWWHHEKARVPILRQYENFSAALRETAQHQSLSFFEQAEMKDISPPSGYVIFSTPKRRANTRIQSNSSRQSFGGYVVTLQWRTSDQYQTWQGYSSIAKSLDEVVWVLHHWLVNYWDLTSIKQEYLWMRQAIIESSLQPTWLPKYLRQKSGFLKPLISAQEVYEIETNPEGRLILEALQGTKDKKQGIAQAEDQVVSVMDQPAIYTEWHDKQDDFEDRTKNGTLEWSENGITYAIHHSGIRIGSSEIVKIAESIRWVVL